MVQKKNESRDAGCEKKFDDAFAADHLSWKELLKKAHGPGGERDGADQCGRGSQGKKKEGEGHGQSRKLLVSQTTAKFLT